MIKSADKRRFDCVSMGECEIVNRFCCVSLLDYAIVLGDNINAKYRWWDLL